LFDPNPDVFNRPTEETPLIFHPLLNNNHGVVYTIDGRDYAVTSPGRNAQDYMSIFMRDDQEVFQKVVHVTYPKGNAGKPNYQPGSAWTDLNDNFQVDPGETIDGFQANNHYWSVGWMRPDLTFITPDQKVFRPQKFTKAGVPIYDWNHPDAPENQFEANFRSNSGGTIVMDNEGNLSDGINFSTVDGRSGSYPNLYGRHDGPAARRGLLIAPFRTNGVVEDVPAIGSMTALASDRGQLFLMSMDGLFVASLLQDEKGEVTLNDKYAGGEFFGGFIWRDENDRVLVQLGKHAYRISEVTGLDTLRKETTNLIVTESDIEKGILIAAEFRKDAYSEPEFLTIAKVDKLPRKAPDPNTATTEPLIMGAETARIQEEGDVSLWFRTSMAHDGENLVIAWQVNDPNPWKNGESRYTHSFIGGDCVDLKLDIPGRGPIRIAAAPLIGEDTVTFWQQKAEEPDNPTIYVVHTNEANARHFDVVVRMQQATIDVKVIPGRYSVLLTIPLDEIGLDPSSIRELKGIIGVIFSDSGGTNRMTRLYWHDKKTGLVNDVPSEAGLTPKKWGTITVQP
ncbi:MAG: hypothetical protein ACQKBT_09345, partial [Puniceicoccales bacterium]